MNSTAHVASLKDFEVLEEIGKGAFGYVYKAKRIKDGEMYALKKVFMNKLKPKEKENSLNEIRILASITHNNVISYKEAFYDNASFSICIVMEYAESGDLEKRIGTCIKNKTYLTESEIVSLFMQIVLGLKALHDKKILHRDIKAANIFIFKNDLVKIGDLNVSKVNKTGLVHTQTGTPYYASPEVWNDKPYDSKSDIWSLGCLLYEMTSLKAPFRGTTMKGVYEKVMKGVYSPIPNFYSTALSNLIGNMLQLKSICRPSCDQILSYIQDKMKNLKLTVNPSNFSNNISPNPNQSNRQMPLFDEIRTNASQFNKSATEKLLKTIKIPRRMVELNTLLPKSQYKKKRVNSSFNAVEKVLDLSTNIPSNNNNDLNKTEIFSPKVDQDKSFNDISAYYRAQNKIIDELLNEDYDKPKKLDRPDRSINLKPIHDKSLITPTPINDVSTLLDINEDPVLKAINKPINLKKNLMINKVRNNYSANANLSTNANNSSIITEGKNLTPIHKRILDLKRDYVSNMPYLSSNIDDKSKNKDVSVNDDISSLILDPSVKENKINNINKYNNFHYMQNKVGKVEITPNNLANISNVNTNLNLVHKINPTSPKHATEVVATKIRPVTAVGDLIRHDRNNSMNIKRILNQEYVPLSKLDYSAKYDLRNKEDNSVIQDVAYLPKLQKPNTKNILNLFNHNNVNNHAVKILNPLPKKSNPANLNMNMNLYPIKVENDVYNMDLNSGVSGNPNAVNKLYTRLNPKIITPINPSKMPRDKMMIRDIKIKN